jgi:hypothetical protein
VAVQAVPLVQHWERQSMTPFWKTTTVWIAITLLANNNPEFIVAKHYRI